MTDRWRVGERRPPGDFDERDQWRMDGRTVDELGPQDALDGQTVAVGNSDSRTPSTGLVKLQQAKDDLTKGYQPRDVNIGGFPIPKM